MKIIFNLLKHIFYNNINIIFYIHIPLNIYEILFLKPGGKTGENYTFSHILSEKGLYNVKVRTIDIFGADGDWENLEVNMPKSKSILSSFISFV